MTDDRAKLPDVELAPLGSAGDKLAPRVVKAEGSHGGTTGDGESAGVAEVNVERLATDTEYSAADMDGLVRITRIDPTFGTDPLGFGLQPTIWVTREELEDMYPGYGKRDLP